MRMHSYWQRIWLYCLKQNPDYAAYCAAMRSADLDACKRMESRLANVAELYADFGDLQEIDVSRLTESYKAWATPRHALFYVSLDPMWIEHPADYQHRAGHLLVEIPTPEKRSDAIAAVEKYLKFHYQMRPRCMNESTKVAARLASAPMQLAKYSLHGDFTAATRLRVRKAIYAGMHRRLTKEGKPLSISDTVLAMKQDPRNPFRTKEEGTWTMTADDKRDLATGIFKKSVRLSTEVTLLKRARKDFDALVRNTIHGRFPDLS